MRIGILTFHRASNYGAVLQTYALQQICALSGHNTDVIDYQPKYITDFYKPFRLIGRL